MEQIIQFLRNQFKDGYFNGRILNPKEISGPVVDAIVGKKIPEYPKEMSISIKGIDVMAVKGEQGEPGEDGHTPTKEELIPIIKPLIPEPIPGKPGKDYILTVKDKKEIAKSIKVPVVEKVVETIIKEQPIVTNEIVEKAVSDKPEEIVNKLQSLDGDNRLDASAIKGLEKISTEGRKMYGKAVKYLSNLLDVSITSPTNGEVLKYNSTTGKWENGTVAGGSGTPGGSDTQVQFNDGGSFGGDAGLTYNKTTDALTIGGGLTVDTDTLFVDATNNKVGIGTVSPQQSLHVSSGTTYQGIFLNGNVAPNISFAQNSGITPAWKVGISGNLGTSFSISSSTGATDRFVMDSSGNIEIGATNSAPTHTLTLGSASTGIAIYNTADQTTAYERLNLYFTSNQAVLSSGNGVGGTSRPLILACSTGQSQVVGNHRIDINTGGTPAIRMAVSGTDTASKIVSITTSSGGLGSSSTVQTMLSIEAPLAQSGTAGYTCLSINPTETSTGSGTKLLISAQVGGVDKFKVDNTGVTTSAGNIIPLANDGASLGISGTAFADLFLASGGVINWNAGNATLTHSAGLLTSNVPLSLGTSNALTTGTVELGHASDTTLSRSAAGVLAVEGVVIPSISSTNTLTNKRVTRRLTTTNAPGATPSTNTDNVDVMNFTGLGTAITSMTTNLTGTPTDGDLLEFRFIDDGTARGITWGTSFASTTVTLPTTTVISTCLRVGFEWRAASSKWECIATC